jgi:hypothetical protein
LNAPVGSETLRNTGLICAAARSQIVVAFWTNELSALSCSLPSVHAFPAAHSSAPDDKGQGGKTDRPPDHKAQDRQCDPGWFSQLVEHRNDRHVGLACEC